MAERREQQDESSSAQDVPMTHGAPEAVVRQALRQLDPQAGDDRQDYPTVLRRLQAAIDVELSKWTSAPVQPVGKSGETAVPPEPDEPEKDKE